MKRIKWIFIAVLFLGTLSYWLSLTDIERTLAPWALRKSLLYYTGVMSFLTMTLGVVLALRLRIVERWIGGLDTHYRLHKWLGLTAALFALTHWLSKHYKWLIEFGMVDAALFKTPVGVTGFFDHRNIFNTVEDLAKDLGEWALYVLLALAVLALWKKFPYRYFFKTHRILALIYLMLALHTLVLFGKIDWWSPVGLLVAMLLLMGVPAALTSLFKQIGANHRASGLISNIRLYEDGKVTEVTVTLTSPWEGHKEGQFAFVTFDAREGHHPFTLSSHWKNDATLTFHIKQLGDYTNTLSHTLKVGDPVTVEGPYGRFDFAAHSDPQIWIAGGIGITPFLSRLEALAISPNRSQPPITLFYSARESDHALIEYVKNLTQRANIPLHISLSKKNPALTAQKIKETVPDFLHRSVWFCGSTDFGVSIKRGLAKEGLSDRHFHQELFEMR